MSEVRGIYAALLHQDAKNISMCQLTVRGKGNGTRALRGSTNLFTEVCQQLQQHTHAAPVAGHVGGFIGKSVISILLHCLRHYSSTSARYCPLIGGNETACAQEMRARLHAHTGTQPRVVQEITEKKRTEVKQQLVSDSLLCDQTENTVII